MARMKRQRGQWVAIANQRAKVAAPTHYRTLDQILALPRKVRRFGKDTYPRRNEG